MAKYEKISYERDGDIAIIAFDDDKTLNACGVDTAIELLHAFEVAAKEARCTILTGKGRGFCSGANLGGMGSGPAIAHPDSPPDAGKALDAFYNPLVTAIREHPHPVITAVNGTKVNTVPELLGAVAALKPGQPAPLDVTRREARQQVQITPAQRAPARRAGR